MRLSRLGCVAALIVATGCQGPSPTAVTTSSARTPSSAVPSSASSSAAREDPALCDHAIGEEPPSANYTVIGDAVALPLHPEYEDPLQASRDPATGAWYAKAGLLVRTGARISITQDSSDAGIMFGWAGSPSVPAESFTIGPCPGAPGWRAYAGGFWVTEPGCYAFTLTADDRAHAVKVAIGDPCAE